MATFAKSPRKVGKLSTGRQELRRPLERKTMISQIQVTIPYEEKYGFLTVKLSPTGGFDCKKENDEVYIVLEDNEPVLVQEGQVTKFSTYGENFTAYIPSMMERLIITKE